MGYDTKFSLETYHIPKDKVTTKIKFIEDPDVEDLILLKFGEGLDEPIRWYEHEESMIELSKDNPDIIFKLEGQGDINDDMWIKYFYQGKIQRCEAIITFDEFDLNKLENLEE